MCVVRKLRSLVHALPGSVNRTTLKQVRTSSARAGPHHFSLQRGPVDLLTCPATPAVDFLQTYKSCRAAVSYIESSCTTYLYSISRAWTRRGSIWTSYTDMLYRCSACIFPGTKAALPCPRPPWVSQPAHPAPGKDVISPCGTTPLLQTLNP